MFRRVVRDSNAWISACMFERALSMALCWASRPGRLELVCVRVCWRWELRARPRLWRSMSFSGFGGMGGGGRFVVEASGMERVRGASRRSGIGGGFCCGGGCCWP